MKTLINFKKIIGQNEPIYILKSLLAKDKMYKTLLFSGIEGVGKRTTSLAFAAACNCQKRPFSGWSKSNKHIKDIDSCGICKSCKMIAKKQHPDVFYMHTEKEIITVTAIRELLNNASMKPYQAQHKIIILSQAQKMNIEASNAFLKFLEEPNFKVTIILIALSQMDLIPTIVSRCEHIKFIPINLKTIKLTLINNRVELNSIETAINLTYGSFLRAKQLINTNWNDKRIWIIANINLLCCNEEITNSNWLYFSEILSSYEHMIEEFLFIIQVWLRDILVYHFAPKKIINIDMQSKIAATSSIMNYDTSLKRIIAVQKAMHNLRLKSNIRLTLDKMVLEMMRKN